MVLGGVYQSGLNRLTMLPNGLYVWNAFDGAGAGQGIGTQKQGSTRDALRCCQRETRAQLHLLKFLCLSEEILLHAIIFT